jgi:hypothetical protein
MKRTVGFLFLITFFFLGMMWSQEKKKETKKAAAEESRTLVTVEKVKPVPAEVKAGFESIDGEDGIAYLKFLSSDALEGRGTATLGHQAAAQFAATLFEAWGLKPAGDKPAPASSRRRRFSQSDRKTIKPGRSYFQRVELKEHLDSNSSAKVEWREGSQHKSIGFQQDVDYQYRVSGSQEFSAPVVFVGYGISEKSLKFDEYKGVDVKGKIVMMLSETPRKGDKDSPFEKGELKKKYYQERRSRRSRSPKSQLAMKKGAIAVLLVENSPGTNRSVAQRVLDSQKIDDERPILPGKYIRYSLAQSQGKMPWETIPTVRISRQMADQILDLNRQTLESLKRQIEKTMKPASMALKGTTFTVKSKLNTKLVQSMNVLGYLEGSDPGLKDEVIVIGAHLDHLGKRGDYIFNGADDNGSGSVSVLEVAQAFAVNPQKPKRTVVFALWTGEEKGLLGSRYYVSNSPFPREKTITYINLDMVSRLWDKRRLKMMGRFMGIKLKDEELKNIDLETLITIAYPEQSPDLFNAFKDNNEYVGLSIIVRKSSGMASGGGSDHMSFGFNKIPWVAFFGAITQDYHQTSDTFDRTSMKLMQKAAQLTYLAAAALANKE